MLIIDDLMPEANSISAFLIRAVTGRRRASPRGLPLIYRMPGVMLRHNTQSQRNYYAACWFSLHAIQRAILRFWPNLSRTMSV